jgi:ribonuclease P protein component
MPRSSGGAARELCGRRGSVYRRLQGFQPRPLGWPRGQDPPAGPRLRRRRPGPGPGHRLSRFRLTASRPWRYHPSVSMPEKYVRSRAEAFVVRSERHEENLSAEQPASEAHPRLSGADGDQGWSAGDRRPSPQGPGAAKRLIRPGHPVPVGCPRGQTFRPGMRLRRPSEYARVFRAGRRVPFPNGRAVALVNDLGHPRLGLAISRRQVRRAVERNRIKRLVRESFRHVRCRLGGIDVVVTTQPGIAGQDAAAVRQALDHLWQRLGAESSTD